MKIILYSDDINLILHWENSLDFDCLIIEDAEKLKLLNHSTIILNICSCLPTCKAFIKDLIQNDNDIMLMHRVPDIHTAKEFLKMGVKGYGNALMREHFMVSAIHTIKDGMIWLHPEFTTQLITEIPKTNQYKDKLSKLSQREIEVALLLKEGETYKIIADKLKITPRTVKAHAQKIYSKLNIKDRLALALLLR